MQHFDRQLTATGFENSIYHFKAYSTKLNEEQWSQFVHPK